MQETSHCGQSIFGSTFSANYKKDTGEEPLKNPGLVNDVRKKNISEIKNKLVKITGQNRLFISI